MKYLHLATLAVAAALIELAEAFYQPEKPWLLDVALGCLVLACLFGMLHWRKKALEPKLHPEAASAMDGNVWGEHPQFPRDDWRMEAAANDTQLGYWEWVSHELESRDSFTEVK